MLHTWYTQKVIYFVHLHQLKVKTRVFNIWNILLTICVGRVWIVIRYFLFEKQAFNGLLKVIGIQRIFAWHLGTC